MLIFDGSRAHTQLRTNMINKTARVPNKQDLGYRDGGIFPRLNPKFTIGPGEKIFTIGSCFARNIENLLLKNGFIVPVANFSANEGEIRFPAPHLLNEYNAGTIFQRISSLDGGFDYGSQAGIEQTQKGFIDLFLHVLSQPVSMQRLMERRKEIDRLYEQLKTSDLVIITLGLVECWYDKKYECYLNKAPSKSLVDAEGARFEFHRLDLEDVYERISNAVDIMLKIGAKKVLITVSPVPVEATFTTDNCVVANSYSKSVLRVCADLVSKKSDSIDYFPSYEIVTSFGTTGFVEDNIHVSGDVINKVTRYMIENYVRS